MKNLYCAFLSCTLALSIANQTTFGASAEPAEGSVRSRQLTHSRYKPDDGVAGGKREMAKAAAIKIFEGLCTVYWSIKNIWCGLTQIMIAREVL